MAKPTLFIINVKILAAIVLLPLVTDDIAFRAVAGDYTFSCWLNGWRKNANDRSADIFAIETSQYGFALDVADFRKVAFPGAAVSRIS